MGGLALGQSVSDKDAETCTDKPPPSSWGKNTCKQQKAIGNCEKSWFRDHAQGYCHRTCGKCTPVSSAVKSILETANKKGAGASKPSASVDETFGFPTPAGHTILI